MSFPSAYPNYSKLLFSQGSCYDLSHLILWLLAQGLLQFEHLSTDLLLHHTSCGLGSVFSSDLFAGHSVFPWWHGSNRKHSSLCLEAIFIAPLRLLLIRFDGDHCPPQGKAVSPSYALWRGVLQTCLKLVSPTICYRQKER